MSWLSGTSELVTGGWLSSAYPGLGATGAVINAAGTTGEHGAGVGLNDGLLPVSEYIFEVAAQPSPSGSVAFIDELGRTTLSVAADGAFSWSYRLREDGVYQAPNPVVVTVTVGAVTIAGAAANCAQTSTCTAVAGTITIATASGAAANCTQANACTAVAGTVTGAPGAMGKYCASVQLAARYGQIELIQLTNPTDPAATDINFQRVDDATADIDALIDAKLAARYALPLASVPLVLRNIACDLVRARLYEDNITDRVAERERAAMKLLDQISSGAVSLGLDAAAHSTPVSGGPDFVSSGRVFTGRSLADYAP